MLNEWVRGPLTSRAITTVQHRVLKRVKLQLNEWVRDPLTSGAIATVQHRVESKTSVPRTYAIV
jgi:hypothetical protein